MHRSERLQTLIGVLRDGALHRAADLAARLRISDRTLYRDMETLRASGLPVEGTRGSGYRFTAPAALPPLNLTLTELEALHLGLAVVADAPDAELSSAAVSLADKIDAALPGTEASATTPWGLATYPLTDAVSGLRHLPTLRAAIRARQKLRLTVSHEASHTLWPLGLDYRARLWTLIAWSEEDGAFRALRTDRIDALETLPELFIEEPGRTLTDFYMKLAHP